MIPVFKIIGKSSIAKSYHLVSLLSVVSKIFEKLVNSRIIDHFAQIWPFQYGFRCYDQLHIFWYLYLIESLGLIIVLGLLELWHLIYLRLLARFQNLVFFTNSNLAEFQP